MARNVERDAMENECRREKIESAGLQLFAKNGIETVTLQAIADMANVGVATVYKYYGNKVNLVTAISARIWGNVFNDVLSKGILNEEKNPMTAYQAIEVYLDYMIDIYKNHPEVLRFSSNYKTYICRENVDYEQVKVHVDKLLPIKDYFHVLYEKAKIDKSIRTDIPEDEMYTTVCITMLSMVERFTQGLVWTSNGNIGYAIEIEYVKQMILSWVKNVCE